VMWLGCFCSAIPCIPPAGPIGRALPIYDT
jgi:hypothetical protein